MANKRENTPKVESTPEAWESGALGRNATYVEKVEIDEAALDKAVELQMISIRLQKSLIDDLKAFAKLEGLGYQPLIKRILMRWVDGEKKAIANQCIAETLKAQEEGTEDSNNIINRTKRAAI